MSQNDNKKCSDIMICSICIIRWETLNDKKWKNRDEMRTNEMRWASGWLKCTSCIMTSWDWVWPGTFFFLFHKLDETKWYKMRRNETWWNGKQVTCLLGCRPGLCFPPAPYEWNEIWGCHGVKIKIQVSTKWDEMRRDNWRWAPMRWNETRWNSERTSVGAQSSLIAW